MSVVHQVFMVLTRATSIYIAPPLLCSHFTSPCLPSSSSSPTHKLHKVIPPPSTTQNACKFHFTATLFSLFSCQSFSPSCRLFARGQALNLDVCVSLAERWGRRRKRTGDGRLRRSQVIGFYGWRGKLLVALWIVACGETIMHDPWLKISSSSFGSLIHKTTMSPMFPWLRLLNYGGLANLIERPVE